MSSFHVKKPQALITENSFFELENLCTWVDPKCGSCKCCKCPPAGSKYSFTEQKQYDRIFNNLHYDSVEKRWYTEYPWVRERCTLPKNDRIAYQSLLSLERRLAKDPELAEDFCKQVEEMISSERAIILSDEQLSAWEGDYYFLPIVAVKGKKKWLRLCHDASRRQGGYPSMNECLSKGPDRFLNSLPSVLIGFRNGRIGCVADIAKFHNKVYLVEKDIHMQRFLWRRMETTEPPLTLAVQVNNFGVTSANCIATCALHKSADAFSQIYPLESQELKDQTYVDDELVAAVDMASALVKTARLDEICEHAGMPDKGWIFSGDDKVDVPIGDVGETEEKVLGNI